MNYWKRSIQPVELPSAHIRGIMPTWEIIMRRALIVLLSAISCVAVFSSSSFAASQFAGTPLTIPQIQGTGARSPFAGQKLARPLRGCVTGVAAEGFFLQDPVGDGDSRSSDGIYVYRYSTWKNPRSLKAGDLVELYSYEVTEFYGQTEINRLPSDKNTAYRVLGRCALPAAVPISPPADPRADPAAEYEAKEGMRVVVNLDGSAVGPTERYESRYPAGDPELTLAPAGSPLYGTRIFADELAVDRGTLALSGGLGVDLPPVNVFDHVTARGLTGVLAYQFGRYVLLVDDPAPVQVEPRPVTLPSLAPAGPDEWTACTFNAENLFDAVNDQDGDIGDWTRSNDAGYRAGLARRAALIRERLGGCTVLAAQEVEGKDAVWADLAASLGADYRFDYRESADARDITVGLIYNASRVSLRQSTSVQACSAVDYGVNYASAKGRRVDPNPCPAGTFPLYDRPPYVADALIANATGDRRAEVRFVVVHLKSKRGDEAENATRRVEQTRRAGALLSSQLEKFPLAIALGDFNDGLGSEPLAELGSFVNVYERYVPPADRYSYIYNGRAQALDHVLMTPEMDRYIVGGGPVHVNADYAEPLLGVEGRTSDHDPLVVRFAFEPTGLSTALVGAASGAVGQDYHQPLRLK